MSLRDLHATMLRAAVEAAPTIMTIYGGAFHVAQKADASPVTDADKASEAVIVCHLANAAPDIPIIAEEAFAAGRAPLPARRFFLVDPLDGTREFISRNGEFTINIALIDDGFPVAGVVFAPAKGRLFATQGHGGAFEASPPDPMQVDAVIAAPRRKLRCANSASTALRAVASRSHRDAQTDAYLARHAITDIVSAGSSLKFCLLAANEADVYPRFGPTMQWDTAAGHAILRAAGGEVFQLSGDVLCYGCANMENPPFIAWRDATEPPPL